MAIIKNEFALAVNQVAQERGIPAEEVITSIEQAVIAAYVKEYLEGDVEKVITAKVSRDNGEARIFDESGADVTPPGFGRIAAQTARNVIVQKIREAERKTAVSHYHAQIGTLVKGRIIRADSYGAYIDLNRTEGIMPKSEQIPGENYSANMAYTYLLKKIEDDKMGRPRIVLSRASPEFIVQLFKREVPEIASSTVEIKAIVREPGERAKIAVWSTRGGVDPVGACVGQKGVRVQVVTDELNRLEKIDIIQWQDDVKKLIANALSPAVVESIELDEENKRATVTVKESQAPLAIGRGGVNVNLAGKLSGYDIDIVQIAEEKISQELPIEQQSPKQSIEVIAEDKTQETHPKDEGQTKEE
jgi:transcription termination/antitermination protein NusA